KRRPARETNDFGSALDIRPTNLQESSTVPAAAVFRWTRLPGVQAALPVLPAGPTPAEPSATDADPPTALSLRRRRGAARRPCPGRRHRPHRRAGLPPAVRPLP